MLALSSKKEFLEAINSVYQAFTTEEAMFELEKKCGKKYHIVFQ